MTQTPPSNDPDQGRSGSDLSAAAWFGLPDDASERDIELAHHAVREFLHSAPPEVASWAQRQRSAADAALAASSRPPTRTEPRSSAGAADDANGEPAWDGDPDDVPAVGDKRPPPTTRVAAPAAGSTGPVASAAHPGTPRRRLHPALLVLLVAAVVFGIYRLGMPAAPAGDGEVGAATGAASTQSAPRLDEAKVTALRAKVEANPKDIASLRALGQEYYRAGDYPSAARWQGKIVELAPNDLDARLALGVALFNTGDTAGAETHWLKAAQLNPKKAEVHYDLGFLYLAKNPPDIPRAEQEWGLVVKLAPGSALAKTVTEHLDRLKRTTTTPSRTAAPGTPATGATGGTGAAGGKSSASAASKP